MQDHLALKSRRQNLECRDHHAPPPCCLSLFFPLVTFPPSPHFIQRSSPLMTVRHSLSTPAAHQVSNIVFYDKSWKHTKSLIHLVGAFSPVNHKELHQGWTQTSLYLRVIHFTSHHTTSHVVWAYLYYASTLHGNLHPAGWPISFCGPTQEPVLATANTGKNREVLEKMQVNGLEG